jgi:hypothetical protein
MARCDLTVLVARSRDRSANDDRFEREGRGDRQTRLPHAGDVELSDADLGLVAAAGGGVRVGSDGANN